jgi:hypothetical protein
MLRSTDIRPVCLGVKHQMVSKTRFLLLSFVGLWMWGALSDERMGLPLQLLLVLARAVILWFESRGIHDHILLSQIRDSPNLEGKVPVFVSPRNRVA